MTALAKTESAGQIARPLKVLVPLIQGELSAGDSAGMEHYRRAGEMLLEAKDQVSRGSWGKWLSKNFELTHRTATSYMRLARIAANGPAGSEVPKPSMSEVLGHAQKQRDRRAATRRLFSAMRDVNREEFAKERQARDEEVRLHRELAQELIELGYRALAMRLHPDRGGSKDAMVRLNRIRNEFKAIADTRRFV